MHESQSAALLGVDIGTTTLSFIVLDAREKSVRQSLTLPNDSALPSSSPRANEQDAERIADTVLRTVRTLAGAHPDLRAIGVTGQMHGVVCLSAEGRAVSPLYTWQDARADQAVCDEILARTGRRVFSGYGHATLHALAKAGALAHGAVRYCTIMDYIVLRLTKECTPLMHASNAASLGLYSLEDHAFDADALRLLLPGLEPPQTTEDSRIAGHFMGIPVAVAIGDNQASVYGSVREEAHAVLVNYGTGSQISLVSAAPQAAPGWEARPYLGERYLLCRCALCGGRAYALLEHFLRSYAQNITPHAGEQYGIMNALAQRAYERGARLQVCTQFCGTREDPSLRGSIAKIGEDNFSPEALVLGVLQGMVDELADGFDPAAHPQRTQLIASGNAVQQNPVLRRLLSDQFKMPLHFTSQKEEAAFGAALFGGVCAGALDEAAAKSFIRYKTD